MTEQPPKSSIVDVNSPTANMYGCEPCPKCSSKYRCVFVSTRDLIQCDDCGYNEKITAGARAERSASPQTNFAPRDRTDDWDFEHARKRPAPEGPQQTYTEEGIVRADAIAAEILRGIAVIPSALASTGEQPDFARCLRCVSHELTRDVCWYAGRCLRQATASAATPPSPAAVGDYTEQAQALIEKYADYFPTGAIELQFGDDVRRALSAVASERDAALLARLQEPDVREAVARAIARSQK